MNSLAELLAERERIDNGTKETPVPIPKDLMKKLYRQSLLDEQEFRDTEIGQAHRHGISDRVANVIRHRLPVEHGGMGWTREQCRDRWYPDRDTDPDPGTGNGMDHELDTGRGQVIGGWDGHWFANSRLINAMTDSEVIAWCKAYRARGNTHMWVSLTTGTRPKMNETPYHPLDNRGKTIERLDLILSQGIQPIPELMTQEAKVQNYGNDLNTLKTHLSQLAELVYDRCKLLFPFREMLDIEAWPSGASGDQRVALAAECLQACQDGHPNVAVGIHLRPLEAPPRALYALLRNPYWLAQWPFDKAVDQPTPWEDDAHDTQITDAPRWHQYWALNRNLPTIAFEHSLPVNDAGYPGVSAWLARVRGQYILDHAPAVIADYSGGASR